MRVICEEQAGRQAGTNTPWARDNAEGIDIHPIIITFDEQTIPVLIEKTCSKMFSVQPWLRVVVYLLSDCSWCSRSSDNASTHSLASGFKILHDTIDTIAVHQLLSGCVMVSKLTHQLFHPTSTSDVALSSRLETRDLLVADAHAQARNLLEISLCAIKMADASTISILPLCVYIPRQINPFPSLLHIRKSRRSRRTRLSMMKTWNRCSMREFESSTLIRRSDN